MTDNSVGRPSVMTLEIVNKLEEAFSVGASDVEACFIAGISRMTLHNYQVAHPDFVDRKESLKSMTSYQARKVVHDKILEGNADVAKWQLERKNKDEYGIKTTVDTTHAGELTVKSVKVTIPD